MSTTGTKSKSRKAKPPKFTSTVHEVFPYRGTGLACLVVQSNEDGDQHVSEVDVCDDFTTDNPETVWTSNVWMYSMWLASDDEVYVAHSGKVLRRGSLESPEIALRHDKDITRLCGARQGVYLVGLGGYVGYFDGEKLRDLPVPDADVYCVAEAQDGTLWAAGSRGRVFRRVADAWQALHVGGSGDVRSLLAQGADTMYFAGEGGLCGHLVGDAVTRFEAPAERGFHALAALGGRVFVGAGRDGLDVIDGNRVVSFKDNVCSFTLFADEAHLCVGGLAEAARFDGSSWLATEFTQGD